MLSPDDDTINDIIIKQGTMHYDTRTKPAHGLIDCTAMNVSRNLANCELLGENPIQSKDRGEG